MSSILFVKLLTSRLVAAALVQRFYTPSACIAFFVLLKNHCQFPYCFVANLPSYVQHDGFGEYWPAHCDAPP